jgi:hypothetical protein
MRHLARRHILINFIQKILTHGCVDVPNVAWLTKLLLSRFNWFYSINPLPQS